MLDRPRRTTRKSGASPLSPSSPAHLPAEASSSRRRSAVEVIQSIRTYLNQATAITVDDDEDSHIHFDTPCGYCLFNPDRQTWQVRHRPFGTRPNDVGVLGGDCASPTTVHATTLVARLTCRSKKSKPTQKLVQLLLRRAELRNMLQQVQLPESIKTVGLPCRTNEELDLTPVLQTASGDLSPSRECIRNVLDLAVILCSSFEEQFKGWTVELDSSRKAKAKDDGYFKAVQQLVNACVGSHVIENGSLRRRNTHARREKNVAANTTGNRSRTGPHVIETHDGENVRSERNGPARVTVPDSNGKIEMTTESYRASRAVKRSAQQAGDSDDAKAASKEPTRPTKRAKRDDTRNAKNAPAVMTVSGPDHSVDLSDTLKITRRQSGAINGGSAMSSVPDATVDQSAAKAKSISKVSARKATQEATVAENPRAAKAANASDTSANPGTTMNLRKQSVTSIVGNDANPPGYATRSSQTNTAVLISSELRRSIDVGECEVCLQPYAFSYLSKHRNKVHGLSHKTFGCPYCPETYLTFTDRLNHIQEAHGGQPSKWAIEGCDDLSKVKVHIYSCPLCPGQLTLSGLICHLGSSHQTSIDSFPGGVFCTCPFCMTSTGDGKQLAAYKSVEDLRTHISTKHKGCFLLDDIKTPFEPTARRLSIPVKKHPIPPPEIRTRAPSRKAQNNPPVQQEQREVQDVSFVEEEEQHWEKLYHTGLTADYVYGDFVPTTFGNTLASAIEAVESQIEALESDKVAHNDYAAEMKLYNKGLKDRQQKADAERIEKERHREEFERTLLQLQYENRNKKKRSPEDIKFDEFLARPVYFASTRESVRKSTCLRGECDLCVTAETAEEPETDASNRLIDAPSFVVKAVTDSWENATEQVESNPADKKRGSSSKVLRRGRNFNRTARSVMMLHEMKHSLRFIQSYNDGYPKRWTR